MRLETERGGKPLNAAVDLIDGRIAAGAGDRAVLKCGGDKVSYRKLSVAVNRCGNVFHSLGVGRGERIALLMPDTPGAVAAFFGAVKIGAVAVPINAMVTPKDITYLLNNCGAVALVVAEMLAPKIAAAEGQCPGLKHMLRTAGNGSAPGSFEALLSEASTELEPSATSAGDPSYWCYTSGTTGPPKGVVKSHYSLAHKADHAYCEIELADDDTVYSLAKFFVDYGIHNVVGSLRHGLGHILDPGRPTAQRVAENITRFRPTIFMAIPTILGQLLDLPERDRYDLSSLRHCKVGAEPLPPALADRFEETFGIRPYEIMGMTETGGELLKTRPGRVRPGALGEPNDGVELKVVDEKLEEVPAGEMGRLMILDPARATGYWGRPRETAATFIDDWVLSGDLFVRDEDGYFWFKGRVDEVFDVGGRKVIPAEVEAALKKHSAVADCGVAGSKDEHGLTKPKAFVKLHGDEKPAPELAAELKLFVKQTIAPYNYPRWVEFVDELPRTALGKLERYKLK